MSRLAVQPKTSTILQASASASSYTAAKRSKPARSSSAKSARPSAPGVGTKMSRNFTIHAARDGIVTYQKRKVRLFSGRSVARTEVTVQ